MHADFLSRVLQQHFPGSRIDFDLDDCDRVLRVEGAGIIAGYVQQLVHQHGFVCEELD